jgi:hypothetical protein
MQCPRCGGKRLRLGVVFSGELECRFREGAVVEIVQTPALESRWDDDSTSVCTGCGWSGRVRDLTRPTKKAATRPGKVRKLSEETLTRIERETSSGACPQPIRADVNVMLQAIRQLRKQVQILESVNRSSRRGRKPGNQDTVIF